MNSLEPVKQIIEKYGWVQGQLGNEEIGFCVLGAIAEVCAISGRNGAPARFIDNLYDELRREFAKRTGAILGHLTDYNDSPYVTREHILRLLSQEDGQTIDSK